MRAWMAIPLFLVACGGGSAACDLEGLAEGEVRGAVDGNAWTTNGAAWSEAGDSIQITTNAGGGYRMTIRADKDIGGNTLKAAIAEGTFPIEVSFDDEIAAFALLYPDGEPSLSSKGTTGGGFTIESMDGDVLAGCFTFDAVGDVTSSVEGSVLAPPL